MVDTQLATLALDALLWSAGVPVDLAGIARIRVYEH